MENFLSKNPQTRSETERGLRLFYFPLGFNNVF